MVGIIIILSVFTVGIIYSLIDGVVSSKRIKQNLIKENREFSIKINEEFLNLPEDNRNIDNYEISVPCGEMQYNKIYEHIMRFCSLNNIKLIFKSILINKIDIKPYVLMIDTPDTTYRLHMNSMIEIKNNMIHVNTSVDSIEKESEYSHFLLDYVYLDINDIIKNKDSMLYKLILIKIHENGFFGIEKYFSEEIGN